MIQKIRNAFSELLEEVPWMDEETRIVAREKVSALFNHPYIHTKEFFKVASRTKTSRTTKKKNERSHGNDIKKRKVWLY